MKILKDLLRDTEIINSNASLESQITKLVVDSQQAVQGSLFVALRGTRSDGHHYLSEVSHKNAIALVDSEYKPKTSDRNWIQVASTREIVGKIASRFWGEPSKQFSLVGVTGTNGKTTVTFLLDQIWSQMGLTTGLVGTVKNKIANETVESELTTPGPVELQGLFHRMSQRKVDACAMEVSSIALDQFRTNGSNFETAVFTNFTQDHLDYHQTMDNYFNAKIRLFSDYDVPCIVVNTDDDYGKKIISASKASRKLTYSFSSRAADFSVLESRFAKTGIQAKIKTPKGEFAMSSPMIGAHNLMNILAALGVVESLNLDIETAIKVLATCSGAPGRLERAVQGDYYPHVFVDYAHSSDALENVLQSIIKIKGESSCKIITVFGCGGDRDKTKRPKMAEVVSRLSDITIATSDNPRSEDPEVILNEVEIGINKETTQFHREPNRREAIHLALRLAKPEDIVLIAGKGHENYQIIGNQRYLFDDVEVVKEFYSI